MINFGEVDFKENWSLINDAIIKDRELEIKTSLETSKALQNSELSNDDILKIRQEYINWRKNSPNPIVDLAENFLDKILNRFNLKVKTELDFERKEDIEALAIYFLEKYALKSRRNITKISDKGLKQLLDYNWPGNIRELEHLIERNVLLAKTTEIENFEFF